MDKIIAQRRFVGTIDGYDHAPERFEATAELHQLRGNAQPYFSVTGTVGNPRNPIACGCLHADILRIWPELAPVVALRLADDTGAPMHAVDNGWYWMAGAMGGAGQTYHGGNNKGHHGGQYRNPTKDECLAIWADHVRVDIRTALALRAQINSAYVGNMTDKVIAEAEAWETAFGPVLKPGNQDAFTPRIAAIIRNAYEPCKAAHAAVLEAMRPRWQAEADAALEWLKSAD